MVLVIGLHLGNYVVVADVIEMGVGINQCERVDRAGFSNYTPNAFSHWRVLDAVDHVEIVTRPVDHDIAVIGSLGSMFGHLAVDEPQPVG